MTINPKLVIAGFVASGLPKPVAEYAFHPTRKWRFDFAWVESRVVLEVQGGIWSGGRHTRGAALKKEWEKLNTAAALGWRVLFCEPRDVYDIKLARQIKAAIEF
jgi:very-short-patch-repair endonuclease